MGLRTVSFSRPNHETLVENTWLRQELDYNVGTFYKIPHEMKQPWNIGKSLIMKNDGGNMTIA